MVFHTDGDDRNSIALEKKKVAKGACKPEVCNVFFSKAETLS